MFTSKFMAIVAAVSCLFVTASSRETQAQRIVESGSSDYGYYTVDPSTGNRRFSRDRVVRMDDGRQYRIPENFNLVLANSGGSGGGTPTDDDPAAPAANKESNGNGESKCDTVKKLRRDTALEIRMHVIEALLGLPTPEIDSEDPIDRTLVGLVAALVRQNESTSQESNPGTSEMARKLEHAIRSQQFEIDEIGKLEEALSLLEQLDQEDEIATAVQQIRNGRTKRAKLVGEAVEKILGK